MTSIRNPLRLVLLGIVLGWLISWITWEIQRPLPTQWHIDTLYEKACAHAGGDAATNLILRWRMCLIPDETKTYGYRVIAMYPLGEPLW